MFFLRRFHSDGWKEFQSFFLLSGLWIFDGRRPAVLPFRSSHQRRHAHNAATQTILCPLLLLFCCFLLETVQITLQCSWIAENSNFNNSSCVSSPSSYSVTNQRPFSSDESMKQLFPGLKNHSRQWKKKHEEATSSVADVKETSVDATTAAFFF